MVKEIRWSDNAVEEYNLIIDYLIRNWSEVIAARFIDRVEHKLRLIASQSYIGISSEKAENIRSTLITEHNRLYRRIVSEEIIEIANIFDTRQDPAKNKF